MDIKTLALDDENIHDSGATYVIFRQHIYSTSEICLNYKKKSQEIFDIFNGDIDDKL